ncbi:DMT family transporter [Maritimibacter sp. UBA3975]|uniref:DMT family transporter n=1 Tax=Maritimibacter sp. UBA3975 TaxID=1946833 RepID=UPI000C0B1776|nr:DMT family transporter [Maritimibacter sp. UBA3975]MAM60419.1 EamA family transporter [Maritimibacter sp.]|tara:strand:+ start:30206 stop:31096 length:891 start_codon:yes stop_codon:yes gene_type:complete
MTDHLKGLTITFLGVLFILPDSLMVRLIETDGMTVAFWKALLTGSVTGLGLLLWRGPKVFRDTFAPGWRVWIYAATSGISGSLFVIAVANTSIANVVFILAATPLVSALLSRVFLGERITRRMAITMAVVPVGIAIIAYGSGETEGASLKGDLIAMGLVCVFSIGLTIARSLRPVSMVPAIAPGMLGAALVLFPFAAPLSVPAGDWIWVALHGGFFIVLSTALLAIGPRYLPSAEVALLLLVESVFAPLLAWVVVGEDPGKWALVGGAIVIGTLAVSNAIALRRGRQVVVRPPLRG